MNFRGDAKDYQDLLRSVATEEMGHVEIIANTINMLLEGASKDSDPNDLPLSVSFGIAQYTSFSCSRAKLSSSRLLQEIHGLLVMYMIAEHST